VPKEKLDVSHYVTFDDFGFKSVVFSDDKAVGIIDQPTFDLAHFEPFRIREDSANLGFPLWLYDLFLTAWYSTFTSSGITSNPEFLKLVEKHPSSV
jgi:hypothetical protein